MSYTVHCQRCDRPAVQRRIQNTRAAWLFSSATDRSGDEVRLCAGCIKTIENLGQSIAKARKRRATACYTPTISVENTGSGGGCGSRLQSTSDHTEGDALDEDAPADARDDTHG